MAAALLAAGAALGGPAVAAGAAAGLPAPGAVPPGAGAGRAAGPETAPARLDPAAYPWRYGDPAADDGHGYLQGSCTSFAAWALRADPFRHTAATDHLGAARDWRGAAVDGAPRVGDIAQWDAGVGGADGEGHVAYVAAVRPGGRVTVYEYNWADTYDGYRYDRLSVRTVPAADPSRYLRF